MSDLANVYQLFRSKFEESDFQYYCPPSYIHSLTQSNDKIIFAFRKNQNFAADTNWPSVKTSPKSNTSNNLDLTGSPLKDVSYEEYESIDFSKEYCENTVQNLWTPEEEAYGPLATEKARSIMQNFINLDCRIGRGSIWALCAGTDTDQTVLLQLSINSTSNDQRQFTRGVVRFTGLQASNSISLAQLIGIHRQRAGDGMKFNPKISIQQWCKLCPQITVRLSWHTMGEGATFTVERNARVRLSQDFPINNGAFSRSSMAEYFWQQLQRLALLREKIMDIRANRESGYARNDFISEGEMDLEYVKQKVNNILSSFLAVEPTDFKPSSIADMIQQVEKHDPTDVMERLYDALTLCSNYDDLKAAIDYIFHLSTHSNIVNVPTNGSRFAQLILAMIQDRLAIPSLAGSEPYELLLECGVNKLMNDYRTIFSESGVYELEFEKLFQPQVSNPRKSRYATGSGPQLDVNHHTTKHSALKFQPTTEDRGREKSILVSNFDEDEVKIRINRLAQVHLLLEHLLLLERAVSIPSIYGRVCELYLSQQPYSYGEVYNRKTDLLEFDMDEFMLLRKVEQLQPCARRVAMSSSNLLQKLDTVFYHNVKPLLPERLYPQFECKEIDNKHMFCCYEYDRIERL
ncbi:protein zwilch [Anopheles moucheti]|uniref:protein zwilch n=1 Tax=Anopheles moucheti TaxID=186751 RepID=UPI0022F11A79|nr:protein zwilch [Anopheles moucheti]XP_052896345.1 protein zwilch [Anopheles moucheti]